jgi:hypothetical protein
MAENLHQRGASQMGYMEQNELRSGPQRALVLVVCTGVSQSGL